MRYLSFSKKIQLVNNDIVKVFSYTAISTLVKMITGLITIKVIAVIVGPIGIALFGQLSNFTAIVMVLASGGINSGITKYIAEYRNDNRIKLFLSVALKITLICSLLCGLIMIFFYSYVGKLILLNENYGYVFYLFGLTIVFYALNMMLLSILNGYKEFRKFVIINIAGSIIGLIFTVGLVLFFNLNGALISLVTSQSVVLFVSLLMLRRAPWLVASYFNCSFDWNIARKYFKYSLMALTTAATVPISQMILRGYVISEISDTEAGYWEAVNRISNMYLLVITSSFSVYYLPRLSEIKTSEEIKLEIANAFRMVMPMLLIACVFIYLFRFWIVSILFTEDFYPMVKLFIWQLLGDLFKIASWLLAFLMLAKSLVKQYIISEIFSAIMYLFLSFLLIRINGITGIVQGYFINYVIYFILICYMVGRYLKFNNNVR